MDAKNIELPGSEVESIRTEGDRVILRFSRATILENMTGAQQRTKWWQAGELEFSGAELMEEPPACPCICTGGDVGENIYTYRDMIPIPLESRGAAHCSLRFEGTERKLVVQADGVQLKMEDRPHYIAHIEN